MAVLESAFVLFAWTVAGVLGLFAAGVAILFIASAVNGFVKGRPNA